MADRESKIVNFYESTLAALLASASTSGTLTSAPTTDGSTKISASSGDSSTHYFLVIDPDSAANREVVLVTASSGVTVSAMTRDVENRHGGSEPTHVDGTTVRMAVVKEMFEDIHDRIDASVSASSTTVLTNKSIDSDNNTITNIVNADIKSAAAIDAANLAVCPVADDDPRAASPYHASEGEPC